MSVLKVIYMERFVTYSIIVKLSINSLDQITQTKSGYEALASAYVLHPLAMQSASISGSAG